MSEPGMHREYGNESRPRSIVRLGDGVPTASSVRHAQRSKSSTRRWPQPGSSSRSWINGPSGSGKNHVARAVHAWSKRGSGPLVVLSAGAFSEALLGRELFGCDAGAYPSLPEEYEGALGRAANGTLLIDHIEEVPVRAARRPREGDRRRTLPARR